MCERLFSHSHCTQAYCSFRTAMTLCSYHTAVPSGLLLHLYCSVLALCLVRAPYFSQSSAKCAALCRGLDYSGKARSINTFSNHQDVVTGFICFVIYFVPIFDVDRIQNRIQIDLIVTDQIIIKC
jgi:hypothetical protein